MYTTKLTQKLYICLMTIVLLMVTATVLSILQVSHPISGGEVQTDVQVNMPTPTPTTGVAGASIERQESPAPTTTNDIPLASKTLSTATTINTPVPTQSPIYTTPSPTPTIAHVTASPIACALGPTPLPHSTVFCKDLR